jgi:hypothetical protein
MRARYGVLLAIPPLKRAIESHNNSRNPSRMNTCESVSKQRALSPCRMNTSTKPRGRGPIIVNQRGRSYRLSPRSVFALQISSETLSVHTGTPANRFPIMRFRTLCTHKGWRRYRFQPAPFPKPSNLQAFKHFNALHFLPIGNKLGSAGGRSAIASNSGNCSRSGSGTFTLEPFNMLINCSALTTPFP